MGIDRRNPVVIADVAALQRLAAVGALDTAGLADRLVIIVDMLHLMACRGEPRPPYAEKIIWWVIESGNAVERFESNAALVYHAAREEAETDPTPFSAERFRLMKILGVPTAVREYVESCVGSTEVDSVQLVYHDQESALPQRSHVPHDLVRMINVADFLQELANDGRFTSSGPAPDGAAIH